MHAIRGHTQRVSREGQRIFVLGGLWILMASTICALAMEHPAQAAVFNIPAGDVAALIAAINTANGNEEENTIHLEAGTYLLTVVDNDTDGPNGLPSITSAITIPGVGASSTSIARPPDPVAPPFRLLYVAASGVLTLADLTLTGGRLEDGAGGGLFNAGTLTLARSVVQRNAVCELFEEEEECLRFAPPGSGSGGGIHNTGTLALLDSTVSENQAGQGGGIRNSGTLTMTGSTVSFNIADLECAGIDNSGTLTITNSTISGNRAEALGGGICGPLTLTHSTVTGNIVFDGGGGGIVGSFTTSHSIIAGNFARSEGAPPPFGELHEDDCLPEDALNSLGHNLLGVGCPIESPDDQAVTAVTLRLGPLRANGGPTPTHAILPGSPAIDAGGPMCTDANGAPLLSDQRGKPRVIDGNGDGTAACDIGAFEFFPMVNDFVTLDPAPETAFDPTPVAHGPAGTFTITATFTNTSATSLRVPFFLVTDLSGGNLVLNADEGVQGVGATRTPEVGDGVLAPGETVAVDFVIGLQVQEPFTFFVDLFGEPVP